MSRSGLKNDKLSYMTKDNKQHKISDITNPILLMASVGGNYYLSL